MADGKLGIGIVGANLGYGWGGTAHLPAIQALPGFELAAVCTNHQDTAEATTAKYGGKAYWDVEAMLKDPAVQVVDVCVRVPGHYDIVKAALQAGKHVYCEWPLGRTTAEAEELAALAQQKGLHTMVGLQARGAPSVQRMKELVEEGYVGKVLSANMVQFGSGTLRPRPASATWSTDKSAGVSVLTIAGGHCIDLFCWSIGELAEFSSAVATQVTSVPLTDSDQPHPVTAPDNVLVTGRLEGGAVASIHIANAPWHGAASKIEVYGTEGTLVGTTQNVGLHRVGVRLQGARHDEGALADLPIPDRLRRIPGEVSGDAVNVGQMLAQFARGIQSGTPEGPDFREAVRRHRLLDAIQEASDTKKWVAAPSK